MKLKDFLANWRSLTAKEMAAVYDEFSVNPRFVASLTGCMTSNELQVGATWLLKHALESGCSMTPAQRRNFTLSLKALEDWEARLHALQCFPLDAIDWKQRRAVEAFVRNNLKDSAKFVRAWAYNGFYELALRFPEYREEALLVLEEGAREEAASVRARIRNVLKKGFD